MAFSCPLRIMQLMVKAEHRLRRALLHDCGSLLCNMQAGLQIRPKVHLQPRVSAPDKPAFVPAARDLEQLITKVCGCSPACLRNS